MTYDRPLDGDGLDSLSASSGETYQTEKENRDPYAGLVIASSLAAVALIGIVGANSLTEEKEFIDYEALREEAQERLDHLRTADFEGGELFLAGPNSVAHKSDTTTLVYDFSQNTAEKRFSSQHGVGFGGAGSGGLGAIPFPDIPNIDIIESRSCELANTVKAHFEANAINYDFEQQTYTEAVAFVANHQATHCTP